MRALILSITIFLIAAAYAVGQSPHVVDLDRIVGYSDIAADVIDSLKIKDGSVSGGDLVNPLRIPSHELYVKLAVADTINATNGAFTGYLIVDGVFINRGGGTFLGAFTSIGIDDNADATAITIDATTEKVNMAADADAVGALTGGTVASDATVIATTTMTAGANSGTSGQYNYIASDNNQASTAIDTADQLVFSGATGGYNFDDPVEIQGASHTNYIDVDADGIFIFGQR